ncbi:hypothetical protein CHLRE_14g620233v5 [Chlamydomonas reinhardtii]|uniref:Uncharacterized protein n=1 Tax=Chlamydomonas reinhardtii TaxID=3055 RepID=A0A2K3CXW9_CHLRE|nr:uncharacterized protein CHLRE_14g620233v5 [Chlamydomonas reinhardtii]PNW73138.1 hypothetical protein CHLRE_14g620233v5 [Chlamydomonas reinhardtii]
MEYGPVAEAYSAALPCTYPARGLALIAIGEPLGSMVNGCVVPVPSSLPTVLMISWILAAAFPAAASTLINAIMWYASAEVILTSAGPRSTPGASMVPAPA